MWTPEPAASSAESHDPLIFGPLIFGDAALWAEFIHARDRFHRVLDTVPNDFAAMVEARERMTSTHRRWSRS